MNYRYHYDNLIKTRKDLNRTRNERYYENHHILPKCLKGSNKKENLILLTPREHFLAHWLLFKIYENTEYSLKLSFAFWKMCYKNKHTKERTYSSKQYSIAKEAHINQLKGNKNLLNYKFTDKQKNNISNGKYKKVKLTNSINGEIYEFKSKKDCIQNFEISNRAFNNCLKQNRLFKNKIKVEYE